MRIKLLISLEGLETHPLEFQGPAARLGRDPALEMPIPEAYSKGVSWVHAKLQDTGDKVILSDAGSSNGTFLCERRLEANESIALNRGDTFHLNRLQCRVELIELDKALTVPAELLGVPASRAKHPGLMVALAVAATLVICICGYMILGRSPENAQAIPTVTNQTLPTASKANDNDTLQITPIETKALQKPAPSKQEVSVANGPPSKNETKTIGSIQEGGTPQGNKELVGLNMEVKPVGKYVKHVNGPPSILLQKRPGELSPWVCLRAGENASSADSVQSGSTLVGLPGTWSTVVLDSGIQVDLLGNLPEYSAFPPVLESAVVFHACDSPNDVGMSLLRGRIRVSNAGKGAVSFKVSVLNQICTIELAENQSELAMELWSEPKQMPSGASETCALKSVLGLFTKGHVGLTVGNTVFKPSSPTCVVWDFDTSRCVHQNTLQQLPKWLTNPIDKQNSAVERLVLCSYEWRDKLEQGNSDADNNIRSSYGNNTDPLFRGLALFYFSSIDQLDLIIEALGESSMYVRAAAVDALSVWMYKDSQNISTIRAKLLTKSFSLDNTNLIIRLIKPVSDRDIQNRLQHTKYVELLRHQDKEIRQLALWKLIKLYPDYAKESKYDPMSAEVDRAVAVKGWASRLSRNAPTK